MWYTLSLSPFTLLHICTWSTADPFLAKAERDIQRYSTTGAGNRIMNTLCGLNILVRGKVGVGNVHDITGDVMSWKLSYKRNRQSCECRKLGPVALKYSYLWLLLVKMKEELVFGGPEETLRAVRHNKTMHLLIDAASDIYFYEAIRGSRVTTFYSNTTRANLQSMNDLRITSCKSILCQIQESLSGQFLSFTIINSKGLTNDVEALAARTMKGVGGFYLSNFFPQEMNGHLHINNMQGSPVGSGIRAKM